MASSLFGRLIGLGIRDFEADDLPLLSEVGVVTTLVGVAVESLGKEMPPRALVLQDEGVWTVRSVRSTGYVGGPVTAALCGGA